MKKSSSVLPLASPQVHRAWTWRKTNQCVKLYWRSNVVAFGEKTPKFKFSLSTAITCRRIDTWTWNTGILFRFWGTGKWLGTGASLFNTSLYSFVSVLFVCLFVFFKWSEQSSQKTSVQHWVQYAFVFVKSFCILSQGENVDINKKDFQPIQCLCHITVSTVHLKESKLLTRTCDHKRSKHILCTMCQPLLWLF